MDGQAMEYESRFQAKSSNSLRDPDSERLADSQPRPWTSSASLKDSLGDSIRDSLMNLRQSLTTGSRNPPFHARNQRSRHVHSHQYSQHM
eukprot:1286274-Amorphochlora_amoeboformis.AAC.1